MAKASEFQAALVATTVGGLIVVCIQSLLPWNKLFSEFPIFPRVLATVAIALFVWNAWGYGETFAGSCKARGSRERDDYDALVAELWAGGTPAKVYRAWLTKALARVDVFFGDPGRNDKSWSARALGLETPGARWTAPALDRCLLLALVYPVVTIVGVWIWSGHIGVAERALGLWETPGGQSLPALSRAAFGGALAALIYAVWRLKGAASPLWNGALLAAFAVFLTVSHSQAHAYLDFSAFGCAVIVAIGLGTSGAFFGASAVVFVFALPPAYIVALTLTRSVAQSLSVSLASFMALSLVANGLALLTAATGALVVAGISFVSVETERQGSFFSLFFLTLTFVAIASVWLFSPWDDWWTQGAILLIFGVLTLVNAPFDWFAIGLTRALLRRGLAPGGRSPFFYAALDVIAAPFIIAILAFVIVWAVQTFDDIAVLRAGPNARVLPLDALFAGLKTRPDDPEYWWIWLMLFSTLIPSALNLCIAISSFMRGVPLLNTWILNRIATTRSAMGDRDRFLLASTLSGQIAGGFFVTGVAFYLLGVWLLPRGLPFLGGYLRDFSEALATYNAPGQIMKWLTSIR
jgi:hypothetical protein